MWIFFGWKSLTLHPGPRLTIGGQIRFVTDQGQDRVIAWIPVSRSVGENEPKTPWVFSYHHWLVVSTHLKNIGQIGNLPQIGLKIKHNLFENKTYLKPALGFFIASIKGDSRAPRMGAHSYGNSMGTVWEDWAPSFKVVLKLVGG